MSDPAFSYLDDVYEKPGAEVPEDVPSVSEDDLAKDDLEELSEHLAKMSDEDKEEIFKSNAFGTGFAPATSEAKGTYEPQALNARHREIIRLHALGYKHTQIGAMLSIAPQTVGYVVNSPLGKGFLSEIAEARTGSVKDVHNRLQEMSPFAAEVMLDIMAEGKESNKLRAAEKVLEMTGHKAENKNLHLHTQLTADEIKQLKESSNGGPETVSEAEVEQAEVVSNGQESAGQTQAGES